MNIVWKIRTYCHKTWHREFKQLALLPVPYLTYNPVGSFIEQGIYGKCFIISMNFLCWDFGIEIREDLN